MEYISTIIVLLLLLLLVVMIIRSMVKDKKSGKCSGGCSDCGSSSLCHSKTSLVKEYQKDHCCGS